MEKLQTIDTIKGAVVSMNSQWSDIGAWNSFWEIMPKDDSGNLLRGDVCVLDSNDSIVMGNSRFVAALGVENLVIVETSDAVLVVSRDRTQDVKKVVSWLKEKKRNEHIKHDKVYRPWGSFENLDKGVGFQVKRLTVKPGQSISLQLHNHRSEHWTIVQGFAEIICDEKVFTLTENESTYIPKGSKHRLSNLGDDLLEVIEVQTGDYLDEDDIVRFDDIYNRS